MTSGPAPVGPTGPELRRRLEQLHERIRVAALAAGRAPGEVQLLLAVKMQSAETVRAAVAAGARLLGHNRAQELVSMAPGLRDLDHEMHFIGHLQSNKVNQVVPWVRCVQSVHDVALAVRLDRAGSRAGRVIDVFVQVNTSNETTKSGVDPLRAHALGVAAGALPNLRLRGLMTIGAASPDAEVVRRSFERLAALRDALVSSGEPGTAHAVELSMGMTGDLELAVAAGSTMVRVGTGVFGPRPA